MTSKIIYLGKLRTEATHTYSGSVIQTDAPLDNHGLAQTFSPTDLVCVALGSCILTTLAIKSDDLSFDLEGTICEVEKIMRSEPRRIDEIKVTLRFNKPKPDSKTQTIIERVALKCPVAQSLHPDISKTIVYIWD